MKALIGFQGRNDSPNEKYEQARQRNKIERYSYSIFFQFPRPIHLIFIVPLFSLAAIMTETLRAPAHR
jgi:hypothetical protein